LVNTMNLCEQHELDAKYACGNLSAQSDIPKSCDPKSTLDWILNRKPQPEMPCL